MLVPYDLVLSPYLANGSCPFHKIDEPQIQQSTDEQQFLCTADAQKDADLKPIVNYITDFLSKPHESLGRSGDVCPFTQKAMNLGAIFFRKYEHPVTSTQELSALVSDMGNFFKSKLIADDEYKCVLTVFTNMKSEQYYFIDTVQEIHKVDFVKEGLMLGQFHPLCEEAGLWSQAFRPLKSPLPMLAVRHMAKTDIAFLYHNDDYLSSYKNKFGDSADASILSFKKRLELSK